MTQHMAGVNVYNTNGMMGYSSQHMGGSTTPSSAHMTAHVWKWSHYLSKKWCNANNPQKRGELSCRNLWIRLSTRHFLIQEEEEETGVKKNKVWETTTTSLSLSSLPMLPLLVSIHGHVFCIFPCLPSEHFCMMTKTTGFRGSLVRTTRLSLPSLNVSVCVHICCM